MIEPHGGLLVNRYISGHGMAEMLAGPVQLPEVRLDPATLSDLELIGSGAFSPLTGFMGKKDFEPVVGEMRLSNGMIWPLPVILPVTEAEKKKLQRHDRVVLTDTAGRAAGMLVIEELYKIDRELAAKQVFGTSDSGHPGVNRFLCSSACILAGPVTVLRRPGSGRLKRYRMDPSDTRAEFGRRGWSRIVAFQTRNPIHRAHEYIQKCALEITDGLFIHPLIGATAAEDVPAEIRMRSYEVLIERYYPEDRVLLAMFPAAMRYAGPREAVFHALVRKNYGCTHFIVGRDHAGYRNYYGTYDAQKIFDRFTAEDLGIVPLFFEHTFYCRKCAGMASRKTCPHPADQHVALSGTKVRELLAAGEPLPPEVTRPEVAEILKNQQAVSRRQ